MDAVLPEKLTGFQPVKKFPAFMEPEGSLPHSQMPTTCPYQPSLFKKREAVHKNEEDCVR
jgi:hypothetical protein